MDVTSGAGSLLEEESPSKRPGSLNHRALSPVWSGSSNGSSNRGPVKFGVYLPIDASEREKGIHAFLDTLDIFAIDVKSTLESENRIECKSP